MANAYLTAALATLLIASQAPASAQSIMDDGTRTMHTLREEPHRAAVCVARNIDRLSRYTAQIRQGAEPALVEVHVRAEQMAALAQFLLAREGSTAVVWTMQDRAGEREGFIAAMLEGC